MASSVSDRVDNVAEGIHNIKCTQEHGNKSSEECSIKYKD